MQQPWRFFTFFAHRKLQVCKALSLDFDFYECFCVSVARTTESLTGFEDPMFEPDVAREGHIKL